MCTLNLSFKKYQDSPGLQAGDDEAELLPSPFRRLIDGGKGRGDSCLFFHPRLESRGYSRSCNVLNEGLRLQLNMVNIKTIRFFLNSLLCSFSICCCVLSEFAVVSTLPPAFVPGQADPQRRQAGADPGKQIAIAGVKRGCAPGRQGVD